MTRTLVAGLISGSLVLGIGGRVLMRFLALFTPEDPRFSLLGTVEIVSLAAVWGLVTGPLLLLVKGRIQSPLSRGIAFGLVDFVLAAIPFLVFSGFGGRIVAPASFLWLSALTFPLLFVIHGVTVERLVSR